jgi:hypothetical protein
VMVDGEGGLFRRSWRYGVRSEVSGGRSIID